LSGDSAGIYNWTFITSESCRVVCDLINRRDEEGEESLVIYNWTFSCGGLTRGRCQCDDVQWMTSVCRAERCHAAPATDAAAAAADDDDDDDDDDALDWSTDDVAPAAALAAPRRV